MQVKLGMIIEMKVMNKVWVRWLSLRIELRIRLRIKIEIRMRINLK